MLLELMHVILAVVFARSACVIVLAVSSLSALQSQRIVTWEVIRCHRQLGIWRGYADVAL